MTVATKEPTSLKMRQESILPISKFTEFCHTISIKNGLNRAVDSLVSVDMILDKSANMIRERRSHQRSHVCADC